MGLIPVGAVARPVVHFAVADTGELKAHEVQTVWTNEFGLPRPTGLTYDPVRREFLLAGEKDDGTAGVRLSPTAEPLGSVSDSEARTSSPGAALTAVNPSDGLFYVLDDDADRLEALDGGGNLVDSYDMSSIELMTPMAMTFAPSTDSTDDPEALNLFVADSGDEASLGGVTEVSLVQVVAALAVQDSSTLIQTIHTSAWEPASPDPSGIVWIPSTDQLVVVDSEVDETTGAGWHNVNLWRSTRTGTVAGVGALTGPLAAGNFSDEPTGAGYDAGSNTLFVSDDSGGGTIWVVRPGSDGMFGTTDDVVGEIDTGAFGATDTEDPEFEPVSGDLFFLSGTDREIFRIDPVDSVFGNGNDTVSSFDISHLGPTDFEALSSAPGRETLYVGARTDVDDVHKIYEVTHQGVLIRTIDVSIPTLSFISGLGAAPASNNPSQLSLWIVDRAQDNGPNPDENDGKIFEISAPDIGGPVGNLPPGVDAGPDQVVTFPNDASLNGSVTDDGLPSDQVTQSWSEISGPGTVDFANSNAPSTTAGFSEPGIYVLELSASDGALNDSDQVIVTVHGPANSAPVIQPIGDVTLVEGETLVVPVSASDPDDDDLTVTAEGLPGFGSFDDTALEVTLAPLAGDAGSYGPVTVTVADRDTVPAAPAFRSAASAAVTNATGSVLTVGKPAGVQEGDLLLAQIRYRGDNADLTAPPGWIEVGTVANPGRQANHTVLYKFAGASEPASYDFDQNVSQGRMAGGIGAYTGVHPTDPIDAWAGSGGRTETLVAPSVTSTVDNATVVRLWGWRGASATDAGVGHNTVPAGVTQRWTEQIGNSNFDRNRVLAGDHVQAKAGTIGAATAGGSASLVEDDRNAFTVVLAPVPGALTDADSFKVTVTPGNQVPVAADDAVSTVVDTAVTVDVLANDSDGDGTALSVTNMSFPANGSVGINTDETVTYTPDAGFSGVDTFTYRASDGTGVSNVATVTVTVRKVPLPPATDFFIDDDGNIHEADINFIAAEGITFGCNPPVNDEYCPDDFVTRAQMASFLTRAFDLEPAPVGDRFTDDDSSVHAGDIDSLAVAGITLGCNPPANTEYCPGDFVTREQMASFLVRGLGVDGFDASVFDDVAPGGVHTEDINALAGLGITRGCNPPDNSRYCPTDHVTRAQMASFLARTVRLGEPLGSG